MVAASTTNTMHDGCPCWGRQGANSHKQYSGKGCSGLCVYLGARSRLFLGKHRGKEWHVSVGLCLHFLISGEHVWHFAAVEEVVDVLNKSFILDLSVAEEEHCVLGLSTSTAQDTLQIFPPLHLAIALGYFDLTQMSCMRISSSSVSVTWHCKDGTVILTSHSAAAVLNCM